MRLLSKTQSAKALRIHVHTFSRLLKRQLITPSAYDGAGYPLFSEMELHKATRFANAVRKHHKN